MIMVITEEDRLEFLIKTLQRGLKYGFKTPSSPILPLLEVLIDLCLHLKYQFDEVQVTWEGHKNPGLRFLEDEQDVLGNPKQIKVHYPSKLAWINPELGDYFADLASEVAYIASKQRLPTDRRLEIRDNPIIVTRLNRSERLTSKRSKLSRRKEYHFQRRTRNK